MPSYVCHTCDIRHGETIATPNSSQEKTLVSPNKSEIFNRICEALEVTKAAEVADKLGITEGSVSQWKKTGKIALKTYVRISELSNTSVHWLLTGEGEKFVKNTSARKNKFLAPDISPEDTASGLLTNTITKLPTANFALIPVPLIATISASAQQIVFRKEPMQVRVPGILARKDSVLLQIEGDELSEEGLRDGDLVLARPVDSSPENKIVIAIIPDKRVLVRHYHKAGRLVHFSPLEGQIPTIRISETEVEIKWIVSSITRPFE